MKKLWLILFLGAFLCGCAEGQPNNFRKFAHALGQGMMVAGDNMQRQDAINAADWSAFNATQERHERETEMFNNWVNQQQIQLQNQQMIDAVRRSR